MPSAGPLARALITVDVNLDLSVAVWQRSLPITLFSVAIILANIGVWIRCA